MKVVYLVNPAIQLLQVCFDEHESQYYKHLSHFEITLLKKFPLSQRPNVQTPFDKVNEALAHERQLLLN